MNKRTKPLMPQDEVIQILQNSNELLVPQMAALAELMDEAATGPYDSLARCQREYDAVEAAIQYIKHPACQVCPSPLTLDELREMNGEPVWVVDMTPQKTPDQRAAICGYHLTRVTNKVYVTNGCRHYDEENYGKTWLAFRLCMIPGPEHTADRPFTSPPPRPAECAQNGTLYNDSGCIGCIAHHACTTGTYRGSQCSSIRHAHGLGDPRTNFDHLRASVRAMAELWVDASFYPDDSPAGGVYCVNEVECKDRDEAIEKAIVWLLQPEIK